MMGAALMTNIKCHMKNANIFVASNAHILLLFDQASKKMKKHLHQS